MITQDQVQNTILTAQLIMANLVEDNRVKLTKGAPLGSVSWKEAQEYYLNIQALSRQFNMGDYNSSEAVAVYICLSEKIGLDPTLNEIDENYQPPPNSIVITQDVTANATRILFNAQTTISLSGYQATYSILYGNFPDISIWVSNGDGTYTQDTATVPTIINIDSDINLPDSYTWTYPIPTTGYIQISGFIIS
jgi:hypothetical protein